MILDPNENTGKEALTDAEAVFEAALDKALLENEATDTDDDSMDVSGDDPEEDSSEESEKDAVAPAPLTTTPAPTKRKSTSRSKSSKNESSGNSELDLIDPIYQKYVKAIIRSLGSTSFYNFFMESLSHAENEIQFSNRRVEKIVDPRWVEAIENALKGMQHIVSSPRNIIREDELIVNVANAKKAGSDVVQHLAMHASLVEKFDEETGDVRPSKLMQKYREDSIGRLYENRVAYTVIEKAYNFVKTRHDALCEVMSDEFGAKLRVTTNMNTAIEAVHMDTFIHITDIDSALQTDEKNGDIFARISRLLRILSSIMNTHFARHMSKLTRVKGTLTKTNMLKKDPNYHAMAVLWDFFREYQDIGYTIKIIEQNPAIVKEEGFQRDIYHNILFNYLVLKGHLERDKDRQLPAPMKEKKRALKPKFIKEIIEELTEDYDLPDVEIRKVLIEELTKEQLMKEEAAERRRLVEEQAQRKREEEERIRLEKEAEKERLRHEREVEKERIRQEKEAEKERLLVERMIREQEERRRSKLFQNEYDFFIEHLEEQMEARKNNKEQDEVIHQDFEDAAWILEETERLKREELERNRARRREERERRMREEFEAQQKALKDEADRREQLRLEKLAEEERIRKEQLEEEKLIEQIMAEREEKKRREQQRKESAAVAPYLNVLQEFDSQIPARKNMRRAQADRERREREARRLERLKRLEARRNSGK